jgi:hypothetical protein
MRASCQNNIKTLAATKSLGRSTVSGLAPNIRGCVWKHLCGGVNVKCAKRSELHVNSKTTRIPAERAKPKDGWKVRVRGKGFESWTKCPGFHTLRLKEILDRVGCGFPFHLKTAETKR